MEYADKVVIRINGDNRPNPYYLLNEIQKEESRSHKGKLKIFFGYAAGVGKTYAMLMEARDMKKEGKDVVIGYIEPHNRPKTIALSSGIEQLELKVIKYKDAALKELDIDKVIKRRPQIVLVDECAHTNVKGMRHLKRWQDIEEIRDAGIDVYTTLNVQHIESLNDIIESITHVSVRETIPDKVFNEADNVELIDIEPNDLLKRFNDEKVYSGELTKKAFNNFFTRNNLFALREIALRKTADRVNYEVESARLAKGQITVMPTSDAILACIGLSPYSLRIIRTAARMADAHHSKFIALYVETTKLQNLSREDKERLNENFNLVEQLGGEAVTVYGDNIVDQIVQYAKFRNITKIIIGKNHRNTSSLFHYFAGDIVDKLMKSNTYIDVYVIPNTTCKKKSENAAIKHFLKLDLSIKNIVKSIAIMALTMAIVLLFDTLGFSEANIIMTLIIGVIIIYIVTTGYLMGIVSSIIGIMVFNYFFIEPRFTFNFYNKNYITTCTIMLAVSIAIGTLTNKLQKEAKNSFAREKRTQTLYRVSRKLLSAKGSSDVATIGIKYISRLVDRTVVCYLVKGSKLSAPYVYNLDNVEKDNTLLSRDEEAVAYWCFINGKEAGTGTSTFYGAKGYYIPLKIHEKLLGIIGVSCTDGILEQEKKFIFETVAGQIAIALDREILAEEQEDSKMEIERERLRSNLLRSISHDLRSPLAGIKGAVSTIIENGNFITQETKDELLQGVYEDTEWLIRLVENLLSMTRFDEGNVKIRKDPEVVEEVIYEAVQRCSKYFKNHKIRVSVPENVLVVPMDGSLIKQVIINLIDNAVKFSPKESLVEVKAYEDENDVFFEVKDNGIGISEEIMKHIFDRFFTNGSSISDSRRGVGLGLAICKSIVEAHGGMIEACNSNEGGAVIRFSVPKEVKTVNTKKQ